jgi:diguanylate cyclase (GGDEF)-like protein
MNPLDYIKSKSMLSQQLSAPVMKKIDNALVTLGYMQAYIGLAASLFCATIILIGMYNIQKTNILYGWYGVFLLVTLFRAVVVMYYKQDRQESSRITLWRNLFIFSALIGGVVWGATGIILYPLGNHLQQTLIVLVLAGTTAGSVPLYSAVLPAAILFITTALLPLIINLFISQNNLLFDLTVVAYLVYLLALSHRTNGTMRSSVGLQFENHTLLNNLSEAKMQLEMINKKLEQAATHDPLTNVANRNLFVTNFAQAIERAKENKKLLALLYIDLDNFKSVNDIHGHHIGDQLLLVLTERIEEYVESLDIIARLGGDEFTIIVEDVINPEDVAKLTKKICRTIAEPVRINGLELKVSASIGIGVYPIDGDDAEKLLAVADKAMYYVKERGGNNFRFNVTLLTK